MADDTNGHTKISDYFAGHGATTHSAASWSTSMTAHLRSKVEGYS